MDRDERYTVPLYTIGLAASHLGLNPEKLRRWINKDNLLTSLPAAGQQPRLPFIALVEAQIYRELLRAGLPLRAITTGMGRVRQHLGERMLRQGVLAHDGRDILMNLAAQGDTQWTRAKDLQGGLPQVIETGLRLITWDDRGFPEAVRLTAYDSTPVIADHRYAFGQPIIAGTTVRVDDILALFKAGDTIQSVSDEMDLPPVVVESIVRTRVALAA
ncbi:MAG: DUF433 domain-containing protein [Propionibacteriaceae bacterium]|jgi:uncharacterized protein (DUF433 family)|nr:DUF433 domain-containing protein [Propionibacteriaceae bacterium]